MASTDDQLQAISEAADALSDPEWVAANPDDAKMLRDAIRQWKFENPQASPHAFTALPGGTSELNLEGPREPDARQPAEPPMRQKPGVAGQLGAAGLGVIEGATGVTRESSVGPRQEAEMETGASGQPATGGPDIAPELRGTQWEQNLLAAEEAAKAEELAAFDDETRIARALGNIGGVALGAPGGAARLVSGVTPPVASLGRLGQIAPRVAGGAAAGGLVGGTMGESPEDITTGAALGGAGALVAPAASALRGALMPSKLAPLVGEIEAAGGQLGRSTIRTIPQLSLKRGVTSGQASVPGQLGLEAVEKFNEAARIPLGHAIGGGIAGQVLGGISPHISPATGLLMGILTKPEALSARAVAALTSLSQTGAVTGAQLAAAIENMSPADKAQIERLIEGAKQTGGANAPNQP